MADDTELNLGSGGDVIASDDIGPGVKYQRVKLTLGADGVTDGDVSGTNPIPTDLQEVDGVAIAPAQTDDDAIAGALAHQATIGLSYGWDGSNWERLITDTQGHLVVQSSDAESEDGSIVSATWRPVGVGLNYGYDGVVWRRLLMTPNLNLQTSPEGRIAHGTAASGQNPLFMGARAQLTEPSAVDTGDVCQLWSTLEGSQVVAGFDGTNPQHILVDAAGNLQVDIVADAAGLALATNQLADGHAVTVDNATGGAAVNIQDGGNIITVDGTVTADAGTGPWPVTDNAGSLTVDAPVGTPVNVQIGDGVDTVNVTAGGALITEPGSMDTEDDSVAGGAWTQKAIGMLYGWNGSNWERLNTEGNGRLVIAGVAHDTVASTAPVGIAARASAVEPTAVSADGDAVHVWADRLGRIVTVAGHPSPEAPVVVNATASGDTNVISAPGASVSLYIKRAVINNGGAAVNAVFLQENGSAVNRGGGDLAADGGGMVLDFGDRGWKLTANTALEVNLGSAGDVWVSVLDYYIAA